MVSTTLLCCDPVSGLVPPNLTGELMVDTVQQKYNRHFYDDITDTSVLSADVILRILYEIYQPRSVIDVGCGKGSWLAVAESLGSTTLVGLDGNWIEREQLLSKNIQFIPSDFEDLPDLNEKYDLCISLEVAEHVSERNARSFIERLCKASDVILFSAAIAYQGGTHHVNEQWQSYWLALFRDNGYAGFDIFRGHIWNDETVAWWFRQNVYLYVNQKSHVLDSAQLKKLEKTIPDIIHPRNYEIKVNRFQQLLKEPTLKICLQCMRYYLVARVKRLLRGSN